jgi:hypothetical protein
MPETQPARPQAVNACHDLLLWIIPQLDKLPRVRRFTLGHVRHAESRGLRRAVLGSVIFRRGADGRAAGACATMGTGQPVGRCPARGSRRRLEQQPEEPPVGQPQQEQP